MIRLFWLGSLQIPRVDGLGQISWQFFFVIAIINDLKYEKKNIDPSVFITQTLQKKNIKPNHNGCK